jgi:exopolysaccharide biosynthesis polyprenyl glycosylphosphotransferase
VPKDDKHAAAESLKRALDIFVAASGLVLLAPIFFLIALAVKITSPGPVFFVQERYGFRRRRFQMWKFRSMVSNAPDLMAQLETQNEASGPIFKIKNDPRITPLGRFLRRTSLDELPQLWNVFLGDMSLVGPRPMSTRDVSRFEHAQLMRRFSVRPGITGMWQVVGRGSLSFEQWISLDFSYIDQWSFALDLKILARTVPAVLKRSGAA